jgi:hypothetical protein
MADQAKSIAEEALEVITERQSSYDKPEDNFWRIARFWNTYLEERPGGKHKEITTGDVAMMMILVKVAREIWKHKRDNLVDLIGYALCKQRIEDLEQPTNQ